MTSMDPRLARQISTLARDITDIRIQLNNWVKTSQGGYRSITDGALYYYDSDGTLRQIVGYQPDGSFTSLDVNGPPPPAPSTPIVTIRPGVLVVAWDGLSATLDDWPSDLSRVDVHVATTPGFTPTEVTRIAAYHTRTGGTVTLALDTILYYIKFVAVSTSGAESEPSVEVDATPIAPITSNGIKTYNEPEPPLGLGADDDGSLWIDIDNGNLLYRWNGSTLQWEALPVGAGALSDAAVGLANLQPEVIEQLGSIETYYSATDPVLDSGNDVEDGDLWLRPITIDGVDKNLLYRRVGSSWIVVDDPNVQQALEDAQAAANLADSKMAIWYSNDPPTGLNSTTDIGDLWFDLNDGNHPYRWDGSTWVDVQDGAIATAQGTADQALADAADAQATADGKVTAYFQDNAPTSADIGDMWFDTNDGNKLHRWNGSSWVVTQDQTLVNAIQGALDVANTKIVTFYQPGTPTAQEVGDLWVDTDNQNELLRWNGSSWVSVRDQAIADAAADAADALSAAQDAQTAAQNAQDTADGKITTFYQTSAPTSGMSIGDLWFDTDDNHAYRYSGSAWVSIQDQGITDALAAAQSAQTTADGKITAYYQNTAPTGASVGDLWYDTDDGNHPYFWSGAVWVDIRDSTIAAAAQAATNAFNQASDALTAAQAAQATADNAIRTYYQADPPWADGTSQPSSVLGDMWFDTDTGQAYRWNGTTWQLIEDNQISAALAAAQNAQSTADAKISAYYQTTQPWANGAAGHENDVDDIWYDTDGGNKVYFWDGTNWTPLLVGLAALDAAVTARNLGAITTFYQTSKPSLASSHIGDLWLDTDDNNKLYRYDGSDYVAVDDARLQEALEDAATAQATADSKIRLFAQTSAPTGLVAGDVGDLWIDTDDGNRLWRWSGSAWVDARDTTIAAAQAAASAAQADADQAIADAADAQATADGKATTYFQASAPTGLTSGDVGDLWFDTDDGFKMYRWSGSGWVLSADTRISQALADAAAAQTAAGNAQATANTKIVTLYQASPPGSTGRTVGDLWVDTDDGNQLYRWSGSAWVSIRDTTIAAASAAASAAQTAANSALSAAQAAQATADGAITTYYQSSPPWANGTTQPDSSIGDLWFDTDDQTTWRWDSSNWVQIQDVSISEALDAAQNAQTTADGKITAYYQTTQPATGEVGDLWYDTDNSNKAYFCSSTSPLTWTALPVGLNALGTDVNARALGSITTFYQTSKPTLATSKVGDLWIDTDDNNKLYRYNGSDYAAVDDARLQQALTNAATAQATADSKIRLFAQTDAPTGLTSGDVGDLWIDTNDGNRLWRWSGSAWTDARDTTIAAAQSAAASAQSTADQAISDAADAQATADGKVASYFQNSAPTGLTASDVGDLWFDTDDGFKMYRWTGSAWALSADTRISQALTDAANAQSVANAASGTATTALNTANTKITTFYQSTAPSSSGRTTGDLWVDTDDNQLYRWSGSAWVSVRDTAIAAASAAASAAQSDASNALTAAQAAQATADGAIRTYYQSSPPWADGSSQPSSVLGDMWFDSDDGQAYRWNGTSWQIIEDSSIAAALAAAQNAQTTADGKITAYYQTTQPWTNGDSSHDGDVGDLWYDTDNGNKAYFYSGSKIWTALPVGLSALDSAITARSLGAITTFSGSTTPAGPHDGDLWLKPETVNGVNVHTLYRYDSTTSTWVKVDDPEAQTALQNAQDAADLADSKMRIFYDTQSGSGVFPSSNPTMTADDAGDLWFNLSANNKLYRYNGSSWVAFQLGIDALDTGTVTARALGAITTFSGSTTPSGAHAGDLWLKPEVVSGPSGNVNVNTLYRYDGTSWVKVDDPSVQQALIDAQNAANLADSKMRIFYEPSSTSGTFPQSNPTMTDDDIGDLWFDTGNGNAPYRYTGSGTGWVSIQDAVATEALSVAEEKNAVFRMATAPWANGDPAHAGKSIGDLWFDTDDTNKPYIWDGSNWILVRDSDLDLVQSLSDQTSADIVNNAQILDDLQTSVDDVGVTATSALDGALSAQGLVTSSDYEPDANDINGRNDGSIWLVRTRDRINLATNPSFEGASVTGWETSDNTTIAATFESDTAEVVSGTYVATVTNSSSGTSFAGLSGENLGANLVTNPSGLDGTTGWEAISGTLSTTTTQVHTGTNSFLLTATTGNPTMHNYSTRIPVTAGQTYSAAAWFRAATTPRLAWIGIVWQTDTDTLLQGTLITSDDPMDDTLFWSRRTVTGVAPAGATYAVVRCDITAPNSSESHYIDDIQFNEAAAIGGLTVEPGQTITSSGYLKLVSGTGTGCYGEVEWYDAAGGSLGVSHQQTEIITEVPELDENGDPVLDENGDPIVDEVITYEDVTFDLTTTDWTRVYITATAPDNTASAYAIRFYNPNASDVWHLDGVLVEFSDELGRYFDGNSYATEWLGNANLSQSTMTGGFVTDVYELHNSDWVKRYWTAGTIGEIDLDVVTSGKLDGSFIDDASISVDKMITPQLPASETISAGDLIHVFNNEGLFMVRRADSSGFDAHGFVLDSAAIGQTVKIYSTGYNPMASNLSPGTQFLSSNGKVSSSPPTDAGDIIQRVGYAAGANTLIFEPLAAIKLV